MGWMSRAVIGATCLGGASAWAAPQPLPEPLLPAISPTGLSVNVTPLVSLPADPQGGAPVAAIDYVVPQPGSASRLFVNDVRGMLYATSTLGAAPTAYLNLATQLPGFASYNPTDGFSGVAFNPNFAGDPKQAGYGVFYTLSSGPTPSGPLTYGTASVDPATTTLTEWTATDPKAATFSGTSRTVMTIGTATYGHNGGAIAFNPTAKPGSADYGLLYVGFGVDGFNDPLQNGGNLANPYGKILRINPAASGGQPFSIPASNPFVATPGALPEIWAYGLRFPQSFSWDSVSGAMYINDIGQASVEEVDVGRAGANYGWPVREGTFATNYGVGLNDPNDQNAYTPLQTSASLGLSDPIAEYDHTQGAAIGSGFVYEGSAIPALDGMYVLADIVSGDLFYFDPNSAAPGQQAVLHTLPVDLNGSAINVAETFGYSDPNLPRYRVDARLSQEANGELLLSLKSDGTVFSLSAPSVSVPEPGSAAMSAVALTMLCGLRRRRAEA